VTWLVLNQEISGILKGKVPSWVGIPTSVALPFGVFEKVISEKANQVS
jgi:alpha-glucan,water dikinase